MKYYYGIVYLKDGQACLSGGCLDERSCMELIKKCVAKNPSNVEATTYIVRTVEGVKDGMVPTLMSIFGNPKSRDVMQDKKFIKSLEA